MSEFNTKLHNKNTHFNTKLHNEKHTFNFGWDGDYGVVREAEKLLIIATVEFNLTINFYFYFYYYINKLKEKDLC